MIYRNMMYYWVFSNATQWTQEGISATHPDVLMYAYSFNPVTHDSYYFDPTWA